MLRSFYDARDGAEDNADLDGARWVDLFDPSEEEIALVGRRFGVEVPSRHRLAEIEASSRTRVDKYGLTMSAPLVARQGEGTIIAPTGFILTRDVLLTIRYAELGAFDAVHKALADERRTLPAAEVMVLLLEEIVDRAADRIERVAEALAEASHEIFCEPEREARRHRVGHETRRLRALMVRIGLSSEELVKVRHSLVAVLRVAGFLRDRCQPRLASALRERLETVQHDITSLDEFEDSLVGRVSLLLDAAAGFISIEQNEVVKVLTVASVAGVPPVLIAGIYGMNFKHMPELDWTIGYPLALLAMLVTTLLPILWFKWRDWL